MSQYLKTKKRKRRRKQITQPFITMRWWFSLFQAPPSTTPRGVEGLLCTFMNGNKYKENDFLPECTTHKTLKWLLSEFMSGASCCIAPPCVLTHIKGYDFIVQRFLIGNATCASNTRLQTYSLHAHKHCWVCVFLPGLGSYKVLFKKKRISDIGQLEMYSALGGLWCYWLVWLVLVCPVCSSCGCMELTHDTRAFIDGVSLLRQMSKIYCIYFWSLWDM